MSYRTEKLKAEKKMRRVKTAVACVAVAAMLGLCVFSAFCPPDTWKYNVKKPKVSACEEGQLRMHFLNVGQGDSTLIEFPDGKVALIDGGDGSNASAERVLRYMNALKIDTVDYLVVSHADSDHCGTLDEVVRMKKILNAYLPAVNATNAGAEYAELYRELMRSPSYIPIRRIREKKRWRKILLRTIMHCPRFCGWIIRA